MNGRTELAELKVREEEVGHSWQRLLNLVNEVARARADQEELQALRLLQQEVRTVGQRRLQLMMEMAAVEGARRAAGTQDEMATR